MSRRSRAPLETWGCSHQVSRRLILARHGRGGVLADENSLVVIGP
jgi:hypothetical protein